MKKINEFSNSSSRNLETTNSNKNSWKDLELDNSVLSEESDKRQDKENFWLRLLHMMATVYPQHLRGKKWKKRIGWCIFPFLMHLLYLVLIIIHTYVIIQYEKALKTIAATNSTSINAYYTEISVAGIPSLRKAFISQHIYIIGCYFIIYFISGSISYTRKNFVQHVPKKLLTRFRNVARNMCVGCLFLGIFVGIYIETAVYTFSADYVDKIVLRASTFFIYAIILAATACTLTLRSYVFISTHSEHYKRLETLAKGDDVDELTKCMIESNKMLRKESKAYLESPIVISMIAIFLHLVLGAYTTYAFGKLFEYTIGNVSTELDNVIHYIILLMIVEIPCLLAPAFALTVIGNRASLLLEKYIHVNYKLTGGKFASLIARYDYIFPNIYLFGFTVTKAKFVAVFLAAAVPLLSRMFEFIMNNLM